MSTTDGNRTGTTNGQHWGARSRDWAMIQEGQFRAAFRDVLLRAEVTSGTRLLDAGCGSGMAAAEAGALGATVSGFDAAEALLDIARERVPDGDFHRCDLEDPPFEDDTFDVVTGFNSFQYAGAPSRALAEAGRMTRGDGIIVIMTWGNPEGMEAANVVGALKGLLPPPPPGAPGPFALSEGDALANLARLGGLTPLTVHDGESDWHYPDEETALRGLGSSGVASRARKHTSAEAVDAAHAEAIAPFRQADGSYRVGARYRFLLARP